MEPLDTYIEQIRILGEPGFCRQHPYPFLIISAPAQAEDGVGFRTRAGDRVELTAKFDAVGGLELEGFGVIPVIKTETNPWRSRISLGRAPNNDIVIKDHSISKLHAHFWLLDDGKLKLVDVSSTNGTKVNGEKLGGGVGVIVKPDDSIRFGNIDTWFEDAAGLCRFVASLPAK